jgi:hypothetical protein
VITSRHGGCHGRGSEAKRATACTSPVVVTSPSSTEQEPCAATVTVTILAHPMQLVLPPTPRRWETRVIINERKCSCCQGTSS